MSLAKFLKSEVTRSYFPEQYEGRYDFKREKIYSFMTVPLEVEKLIGYGFFQVVDAFLFIFTFLPLRVISAVWMLTTRPLLSVLGVADPSRSARWLQPSQLIDLMKAALVVLNCYIMSYLDTSMLYHLVKSQSIIKLYMFYNMLEVGDKLMSSFGQDTLDVLQWTVTEPRTRKRHHLLPLPHFVLASIYVFFHSVLILLQVTVLNVAMNSSNKALLIVMMSNNFVELKGSVFKKFDRNNLLQVSCSDIRERFHYCILLFLVIVQTLKEFGWSEEQLWVLLPDAVKVLAAEVIVDWLKHAFITRFNEIPLSVYREYTLTLARDIISSKRKLAFSDHSDMVSHRMGFMSVPVAALASRIILQSVRLSTVGDWLILVVVYLTLLVFRVFVTISVLGKACQLILPADGCSTSVPPPPPPTAAPKSQPPVVPCGDTTAVIVGNGDDVPACSVASLRVLPVDLSALLGSPAKLRSRHTSTLSARGGVMDTSTSVPHELGSTSVHEPYNVFREFSPPSPTTTTTTTILLNTSSSCVARRPTNDDDERDGGLDDEGRDGNDDEGRDGGLDDEGRDGNDDDERDGNDDEERDGNDDEERDGNDDEGRDGNDDEGRDGNDDEGRDGNDDEERDGNYDGDEVDDIERTDDGQGVFAGLTDSGGDCGFCSCCVTCNAASSEYCACRDASTVKPSSHVKQVCCEEVHGSCICEVTDDCGGVGVTQAAEEVSSQQSVNFVQSPSNKSIL